MKRVAVLVTLLAVAFPAMATATIIVNRGMFGVTLGEMKKRVREALAQIHQGGSAVPSAPKEE
jgi:hypothetical protein